jgi:uncharacterized protein (DUF342 family)
MSKENEKIDIQEDERELLENKMLDLEKQFERMEKKMDKILELLEKDCKKMTDHIDFVENVYDNVKMPFYYVMDKVNHLVSNRGIEVLTPSITTGPTGPKGEKETPSLLFI